MPGHAAASGSALGGFIEGALGGFERTTEFRRRRRLEQQVAEQLRAKTARQDREDTLAAEDRERAAADRAREHAIRAFELSQKHGLRFDPNALQGRVDQLRQGVGEAITPGAGSLPPGLTRVGPSAAEREAQKRSGVLDRVAEFMAMSPEEREAAMQDPAMRQALDELGKFDEVFDTATAPPEQPSPRNIDPLSPEGIKAGVEREEALIELRERLRGARIDDRTSEALLRTANQLHQQTLRRFDTDISFAATTARIEGTAVEPDFNDSYNEAVRRFALNQSITPEQARILGVDVSNDADQAGGFDESATEEAEFAGARRRVQGLERDAQEEILAAVGYSADQITRILNGR